MTRIQNDIALLQMEMNKVIQAMFSIMDRINKLQMVNQGGAETENVDTRILELSQPPANGKGTKNGKEIRNLELKPKVPRDNTKHKKLLELVKSYEHGISNIDFREVVKGVGYRDARAAAGCFKGRKPSLRIKKTREHEKAVVITRHGLKLLEASPN